MSHTWKVIVAIIITALVAGGGMYLWQQNEILKHAQIIASNPQPQVNNSVSDTTTPSTVTSTHGASGGAVILYQDDAYRIRFTTENACKDLYSIKTISPKINNALKDYGVFLPRSKDNWPPDELWYDYALYTQAAYEQINPNEPPGKPGLILRLNSGELLTRYGAQDGPTDAPTCEIKAENF